MTTMLDLKADAAPVDRIRAEEIFGDKKSVFTAKTKEIREQIKKGRYNRYSLLDYGKVRINYYVYYDYTKYRGMLKDKNLSKHVPPFEPREIAMITPVHVLHHIE